MSFFQISVQSGGSGGSSGGGSSGIGGGASQDPEEDLWGLWGRLVNDWENWNKKKNQQVKVNRSSICLIRNYIFHYTLVYYKCKLKKNTSNILYCNKNYSCSS